MAIASSSIILQYAQASGKTRIVELHVTDAGTQRKFIYDADELTDTAAVLAARAIAVWQQIQDEECQSFINLDIPPKFIDATKSYLISFVRNAYKNGSNGQLVAIARWILNRINDGTVTDAQVQAAFSLTAGQWTTLKTKMQNLVSSDDTIETAVGE